MVVFKSKLDASKVSAVNASFFNKCWWLFALLSVVLIALGVLGVVFPENDLDLYFGIFMISFGVLFTPLTLLVTYVLQKIVNKSSTVLSSETEEVFVFDADKITITQQKGEEYTAVTTAKYS